MKYTGTFNFDSPVWRVLGYIADAFILTVLWAVTSLPIITIGASTTALYAASLRLMRKEEGSIVKQFFQDFKLNFKQSTIAWILVAMVGFPLGFNLYSMYSTDIELMKAFFIALLILAFVYLMVVKYLFAVIARFSNSLGNLIIIAFTLSIKNFGWTILMITATICLIVITVFVFWPLLFLVVGLIAILDAWILDNIFAVHIAKNNIC